MLNLGGDPLTEPIGAAADGQRLAGVQTNLDEADATTAEDLASDLFERLRPDVAIVTLGRLGALARTRSGLHRVRAATTTVRPTHGAGAAFSAGYTHALLADADIDTALRAGCQAGTVHCANTALAITRHPTAPAPATRV